MARRFSELIPSTPSGTFISGLRRQPISCNVREYALCGPSSDSDIHYWQLRWRCTITTTSDSCEKGPHMPTGTLFVDAASPSGTGRQLRLKTPSNLPTQISSIEPSLGIVGLFLSFPLPFLWWLNLQIRAHSLLSQRTPDVIQPTDFLPRSLHQSPNSHAPRK